MKRSMLVRFDSNSFVAAASSGWSFEKELTKNAVTIAENRPIWELSVQSRALHRGRNVRKRASHPSRLSISRSLAPSSLHVTFQEPSTRRDFGHPTGELVVLVNL
jgi:hypothetical protein